MSNKRRARNTKKFKKVSASKRARAPMQKGGQMYAGGNPNFDERTGKVESSPIKQAPLSEQTAETEPTAEPQPTGVSTRPDNTGDQLPEFTGTVPNTTETNRTFQPTATTRPSTAEDDTQAETTTSTQDDFSDYPNPEDYRQGVNDPAYRQAVEDWTEANPNAFRNINPNIGNVPGIVNYGGYRGTNIQGGISSQAPTNLEISLPDRPDLPQVEPEDVAYGPDSVVYQMADTGDAQAAEAQATEAVAAPVVEAAQAAAPEETEAAQMEAETVDPLQPMEAATGEVSEDALISQPEQATLTERAAAAQRNEIAEEAARATAALRPEEKDYVGDVVRGTPESMTAQIDTAPINVVAAVADLDPQALVSVQMENLLTGLDDGKIPSWARPALAAVEGQLAQRGLTSSTVGRDALFNAIIQSAMPIAQSNAQALQARAAQNLSNQQAANLTQAQLDVQMRIKNMDAENQARQVNANLAQQMGLANLSNAQESAMMNAQINANFDMKQFDFEQQAALANSQFMQTMTMKDFDARQQSIMQNATAMANLDMANLDVRARAQAQNAQAFLQMDMQNLSNEQQAAVLNQQQAQQTLLSNQAAENAARQFNAANQQQADQFMASLASQTEQFNASQTNAMAQFNASEQNRIAAQNAQNSTQVALANAQIATEISRFNAQMDQQREQFNTANQQAIEQADIAWRRQTNTINTAARNAANQQNVMNAFNLSMAEMQFIWQEVRDNAAYTRQAYENDQTRRTQLYATAIGNEAAASGEKNSTTTSSVVSMVERILNF